jgi:hypothetical protein
MSYPQSKPFFCGDGFHTSADSLAGFDGSWRFVTADRAMDASLRSVPLPDGLLNRLKQMLNRMPDEVSDTAPDSGGIRTRSNNWRCPH